MSFVKVTRPFGCYVSDMKQFMIYENCILELISEDRYVTVVKNAVTGEALVFDKGMCTKIDETQVPEDLTDQICYKEADFETGALVYDNDGEVYIVENNEGPMVIGKRLSRQAYCNSARVRMDKLTLIDPERDEVIAEDYCSGEPIYKQSEDDIVTIHGYNRHGSTIDLGVTLPYYMTDADNLVQCDDCGDWFDVNDDNYSDYMQSDGNTTICYSCYENGWGYCAGCNELCRDDDMYSDDDDYGELYCSSCYENHRNRCRLHDYSYKPSPWFHDVEGNYSRAKANIPYMGVELEVDDGEGAEDTLEDLAKIDSDEDLFYCKHDGSLGYTGIEIVTHPCSMEYHNDKFPWNDVINTALEHGYKSHNAGTCGLHVHVSRTGFGDNQDIQDLNIAKVIILVDRFWDELVNFSRRNYNQLDRWAKKPEAKIYSYDTESTAVSKAKNSGTRDRYKAINLTNRNTVEFRLFRGSLKLGTVKATLQFVNNIVEYAKHTALVDVQDAKWDEVARYKEYPELIAYLKERNLFDMPEKPKPIEPKQVVVRFNEGDTIWFKTEATNDIPVRATIQSIQRDPDQIEQPLYIAEYGDGLCAVLIDDEILPNDLIANLERAATASPAN